VDTRRVIIWEGPGYYSPVVYRRKRYDLVVFVWAFAQTGDTVNVISREQAQRSLRIVDKTQETAQ
jgi:hypothetical protein